MPKGIPGSHPPCKAEKCPRKSRQAGFCVKHLQRWRKYGDPHFVNVKHIQGDDDARFYQFAKPQPDGCWLWTGYVGENGYGRFSVGMKGALAHRWAYERFVGPIPAGKQIDHLCHNADPTCPSDNTCLHRRCVNPAHLRPDTPRGNTLNGNGPGAVNARKTNCKRGHPFDEANTYVDPTTGTRRCRTCRRNLMR